MNCSIFQIQIVRSQPPDSRNVDPNPSEWGTTARLVTQSMCSAKIAKQVKPATRFVTLIDSTDVINSGESTDFVSLSETLRKSIKRLKDCLPKFSRSCLEACR